MKSPYVEDSPAKVESPRLWYIVGSLSHAGVLASSSPSWRKGVYGKEPGVELRPLGRRLADEVPVVELLPGGVLVGKASLER